MFGEVKLGEADYTVRAFWCLQPFQGFLLLENAKNICHKCFFCEYDKNPGLMLINMFNPTFAPNLVT